MLVPFVIVSTLLSSTSVTAAGNFGSSLTLKRHLNPSPSNLVRDDRRRVDALGGKFHHRASIPIANAAITYTVDVGVGSPPVKYTLQVDTGSANIWVGHNKTFVPTNSTVSTGDLLSLSYGDGTVTGDVYLDQVTLAPGLSVVNQTIGVQKGGDFEIPNADFVDGIIGLGWVAQTAGTVQAPDGSILSNATVPTVSDNLLKQGKIATELVGIYMAPTSSNTSEGELSFGAVDPSKYLGNITYTPSSTGDWYISNVNITYQNSTITTAGQGLVDTGTTFVYMSAGPFFSYLGQIGGTYDSTVHAAYITPDQYSTLKPLDFHIGGSTFTLNPDAQIWPRALNSLLGGTDDRIYLVVNTYGETFPFQFIIGYTFLERFYSVFDTENARIGFAYTHLTNSTTNY